MTLTIHRLREYLGQQRGRAIERRVTNPPVVAHTQRNVNPLLDPLVQPRLLQGPAASVEQQEWVQPRRGQLRIFGPKGPCPDHVHQGTLADCYLMATLAGMAQTQADALRNAFPRQADGAYLTTFCHPSGFAFRDGWVIPDTGRRLQVAIDAQLPAESPDFPRSYCHPVQEDGPLWPALMEKAVAKVDGGYECLSFGVPSVSIAMLTGNPSRTLLVDALSDETLLKTLESTLKAKGIAIVGTRAKPTLPGLAPSHAFTVLGVKRDGKGGTEVLLRNPKGGRSRSAGKYDDAFWVDVAQIRENFACLCVSSRALKPEPQVDDDIH